MIPALVRAIERGTDILLLATGLLRLCRKHLGELQRIDADPETWHERELLRRRCEDFFRDVDDEALDPGEQDELRELAVEWCRTLPPVAIAHTMAEALDHVLGSRLLPMFLGRAVTLAPGDPIPTPHPDWRRVALIPDDGPDDDPGSEGDPLDAIPHLGLAADWAREVRVTLDGNWRRWHVLPQLDSGDRLACAVPGDSLDDLALDRGTADGRPVFFNARCALSHDEQVARCLALLDAARGRSCRVVAFPELSVSAPLRQVLRAWLEAQDVVDVIAAGSCHVPAGDGRWHNEAAVLIRGLAEPLHHRKFRPLALADATAQGALRHEHLAADAPALTAHLSPHWTVVTLVCEDAVQEPVPQILADLGANLVLVPALGFEMNGFCAVAAAIAARARGITLVANACVGADAAQPRPPLVVGMPSPMGRVIAQAPPGRALVIVTVGSLGAKSSIVRIDEPAQAGADPLPVFPEY